MLQFFNVYDDICGTCEYWREKDKAIGFQNKRMFVQYGDPQGRCLRENNTIRRPYERICDNYKRWHELPSEWSDDRPGFKKTIH